MATENVLEVLDRVEGVQARFERVLFGDPRERTSGLLTEFEGLRHDVRGLRHDVQQMQLRAAVQRPNLGLWMMGYAAFLTSGAFAMSAFFTYSQAQVLLQIPPHLALGLALFFALLALGLFVAGFGWLSSRGQL
jgi:hypothetical protein